MAVGGISFAVGPGEVFGLLGPNGAGKTTTMKVLSTLLLPTRGQVRILGMDVCRQARQIRGQINFVFGGEGGLYWQLTATEYLRYFANLYWVRPATARTRIPELLELVGLADVAHRRIETFSKGMKQRLHLARALINNPQVLFLDEPSIGLDPAAAHMLRGLVLGVAHRGTAVVLTTHYMHEAERLVNRVALLVKGEIWAQGTVAELRQAVGFTRAVEVSAQGSLEALLGALRDSEYEVLTAHEAGGIATMQVGLRDPAGGIAGLARCLEPWHIVKLLEREVTLEDVYLKAVRR